ncbi:MAG TPA: heavy-metal-associated domain-containing protein [Burkholderiales bacterium]|nr:heavy-metal-associated domain-containing protein [Burkholderiales bacterium]
MKKFIVLLLLSFALPAAAETIKLRVDGLVCAFCASSIDKKLRTNAATEDVFVSLEHKLVAIALKDGQTISDETLKTQIVDAGYEVKSIERTQESLSDIRAAIKAKKAGQ